MKKISRYSRIPRCVAGFLLATHGKDKDGIDFGNVAV